MHGDDPCFVDGRDVQLGLSAANCLHSPDYQYPSRIIILTFKLIEVAHNRLSCICDKGMNQPEKQADFAQFQEQTLGCVKSL